MKTFTAIEASQTKKYTAFNDVAGEETFFAKTDKAARKEVRRLFGTIGMTQLYRGSLAFGCEIDAE